MGLFGSSNDDAADNDSEDRDDHPLLGEEMQESVAELTDAYDNRPDDYQAWSDKIDEYNEENPGEEL